ncbi:single-stranded-DNA-specific exonuclease RecJ [Clostridia bacterium]|nr:single-stranded-DNA-specific exonuclease RecJ [Clostridia bacterium]
MNETSKAVVRQVCTHCGRTFIEGTVCECIALKEQEEKKKQLLKEKTRRSKSFQYHCVTQNRKVDENGLHPKLLTLLGNRGIVDIEKFITCPISALRTEKLLNQNQAVERLERAIKEGEQITVYGDYDVDGVTSAAIGLNILRDLGAKVDYYINNRFEEGFGIGKKGVEAIARRGGSLILTADNGIAGYEAVEYAKTLGLEVLVTDHHEPNDRLPDCIVVDPKQPGCPYPNKDIVGVGVLFKVLDDLARRLGKGRRALHELDLVAMGTVADVAPLLGENRILVKNGLKLMDPAALVGKRKLRPGIEALRAVAGLDKAPVNAYHLGYLFGPMINAEGRLNGVPEKSVELLTTNNLGRAVSLARELSTLNDKRKKTVEELYDIALEQIDLTKKILIVADARFHEGVVGLLAGRLKKEFYLPAIVLGVDQAGCFKGSGRSIPGFNLKKKLDKLSGLLEAYGGHELACGLTVTEDNYQTVKNMLETQAAICFPGEVVEHIDIDVELGKEDICETLVQDLEKLEPFGQGFPRPKFWVHSFKPDSLGYSRDGKHTRMKAKIGSKTMDFWAFGQRIEGDETCFDILGSPSFNVFRGKRSIQFRIEECGSPLAVEVIKGK